MEFGDGNSSHNHTDSDNTNLSVDNLYPAIVQCFVIILAGYIAGRASLITSVQGKGIGTFVAKFCLPALLFRSMVKLNFETVDWFFLLGIGISKTIVFVGVVVLTLLAKRPLNLGYAGIFGIFATQSNDFALGYPICKYHSILVLLNTLPEFFKINFFANFFQSVKLIGSRSGPTSCRACCGSKQLAKVISR